MTGHARWLLCSLLLVALADSSRTAEVPNVAKPLARRDEMTTQSQAAIRTGTAWMLQTMHRDGGCGTDVNQPSDIGCTAMVGLALLSQGNTPVQGPHSREVKQILGFILNAVNRMPSEDITPDTNTNLQAKIGRHAHSFFAALFLSQAIGEDWDSEQIRRGLHKLVICIGKAQQSDGSWGGQSWAPMLGTVMGWECLRGSVSAGFRVDASANRTAKKIVEQMGQQIQANSGDWMHDLYKHATGIRVLYAMGMADDAVTKKSFAAVLNLVSKDNTAFSQAGGEEYLAFHLITECMLQAGGENWNTWFPVVRDRIVGVQNKDGSWTGHHCITSRTFCTAAALLVLQAPNRFLPISQE